jgi:Fe-Mn family superoxide dismutase
MPTPYQPKPYNEKLDNLTEGITAETNRAHYGLYENYVKKYNECREKLESVDRTAANQIYSEYRGLMVDLTFAIGVIKNHEIYFGHLGGDGQPVDGSFQEQVVKDFGSWEAYITDLKAAAMAGRGWAWTAWDDDFGQLVNVIGDTQNTFPVWNAHPVVAVDVYEHAYVNDFSTARPKYLEAFFANMDWSVVESSFTSLHS